MLSHRLVWRHAERRKIRIAGPKRAPRFRAEALLPIDALSVHREVVDSNMSDLTAIASADLIDIRLAFQVAF